MVKYTSTRQLSIEEFKTPFYRGLDKNNRWVRLASHIPWDDFADIYAKSLREDFGRPAVDARIVIGAMIIKSKKGLTDEETIEEIKENAYLQYFIGYEEFSHKAPFDPSLFVTLRERLGLAAFEALNQAFIDGLQIPSSILNKKSKKKSDSDDLQAGSGGGGTDDSERNGTLIIDSTVAPQDIRFPTDIDLLNNAREHSERLIDLLWEPCADKRKPRTYRKTARKDYLNVVKKRKNKKKAIRSGIRKQLNYLRRNIATIKNLLAEKATLQEGFPLDPKNQKILFVIQEVYRQQKIMYDNKTNTISDRIVSISQPHVRPIVRGKSGKNTEFGAKLSVSLVEGFVFLDHLDWNAFNESTYLENQVEKYHLRFGCYPEQVIGDAIYGSRKNRDYLKDLGIKYSGKPLGRPPKRSKEQEKLFRKALKRSESLRVQIEGKFGEGKRKYDLDSVKAKTALTSESWIASIYFVMNLALWERLVSFLFQFCRTIFLKKRIGCYKMKSKMNFKFPKLAAFV